MRLATTLATLAIIALSTTALAAAPTTVLLSGVLRSQGGGPAADGKYNFTFALYDVEFDGVAVWKEGPVGLQALGGGFSYALGEKVPLDGAALAGKKALYLGVKLGSDPELPRTRVHATAFALHAATAAKLSCSGCVGADQIADGGIAAAKVSFSYAASADGIKGGDAKAARALNCTGCVGVAHLKFDKAVDLGGNALTAGKLISQGDVLAGGTIQATGAVSGSEFIGDGSKLTGVQHPTGDCPKGEAVGGIDAQGKLKCTAAGGSLEDLSGKALTRHFVDTVNGGKDKVIPDNDSNGLLDIIDLPDVGIAESFEVTLEVSKAPFVDVSPKDGVADYDPTDVTIFLFPPTTKELPSQRSNIIDNFLKQPSINATEYPHYVLHRQTGAGTLTVITTYPSKTKPAVGDFSSWIGKNPKGKWRLLIVDNKDRKNADGSDTTTDGQLVGWSITFKTLSDKQLAVQGSQFTSGKVWGSYLGHGGPQLGGDLLLGAGLQVGTTLTPCTAKTAGTLTWKQGKLLVCSGFRYMQVRLVAWPGSKDEPAGKSCKHVAETAGQVSTSGVYWVQPDAAKPAHLDWCDMERFNGGWTLAMNLDTNDGKNRHYFDDAWWTGKTTAGTITAPLTSDSKTEAFSAQPANEIMIVAHIEGTVVGAASYEFTAAYKGKTLQDLFSNVADKTVTGTRKSVVGSVGNNGRARNAGDAFIDNPHALIFNSRYQPKDATNFTRIGTNYASVCGTINCDGHNYGGLGGRHFRSSWGAYYEAAQLNGYCNAQGVYGTDHAAYNGNNAAAGCGHVPRDMDFAIYVR